MLFACCGNACGGGRQRSAEGYPRAGAGARERMRPTRGGAADARAAHRGASRGQPYLYEAERCDDNAKRRQRAAESRGGAGERGGGAGGGRCGRGVE